MAHKLHPVLTVTEYELCMQAWLKDSLIDMMIDIQETLIEIIQKLNQMQFLGLVNP